MTHSKCTVCGRPIDNIIERQVQTKKGQAHELCHLQKLVASIPELEDDNKMLEDENNSLRHQLWMERELRWRLEKTNESLRKPGLIRRALDRLRRG